MTSAQPIVLGLEPAHREALTRRVRMLVSATIAYNIAEAAIAIAAGAIAASTALLGFGLDSVIEVSSALALAWQYSARSHERREAREHAALRMTAAAFFALAAFVCAESLHALITGERAAHSAVGITLTALSLVVMPVLSLAQRRAGRALGSASAVADSKQTLLCTYLSAVVLLGLLANLTVGWWWADPLAGLVIVALAVKEGRDAWLGKGCCAPAAPHGPVDATIAEAGSSCGDGCACCT